MGIGGYFDISNMKWGVKMRKRKASNGSHQHKGTLFVLEGMPGAGKTTVWKRLQGSVGSGLPSNIHFSPVLIEPESLASDIKYQDLAAITEADAWFLNNEVKRAQALRPLLEAGALILQDRSFLSTLCFAYARSQWLTDQDYFASLVNQFERKYRRYILEPDVVLNLVLPPELSWERVGKDVANPIRTKGPWGYYRFVEAWHEFCQRQLPTLLDVAHTRLVNIEAARLSLDEIYERVVQELRS